VACGKRTPVPFMPKRPKKKVTSNNIQVQTTSRALLPKEKSILQSILQKMIPGHLEVNSFSNHHRSELRKPVPA